PAASAVEPNMISSTPTVEPDKTPAELPPGAVKQTKAPGTPTRTVLQGANIALVEPHSELPVNRCKQFADRQDSLWSRAAIEAMSKAFEEACIALQVYAGRRERSRDHCDTHNRPGTQRPD